MIFLWFHYVAKKRKFSDMMFLWIFYGWIYDFFNDEIYDLVSLSMAKKSEKNHKNH